MLKNGRPYYLPQISAPYTIALQRLDDEGFNYDMNKIYPHENDGIMSSQNIVYDDEISNCEIEDLNPIWLSDDGNGNIKICDGHHRYFKALFDNIPIMAIKIKSPFQDACRILNKIQDIFEYEEACNVEDSSIDEVEAQGAINYYGDDENQFLYALEEDNTTLQDEIPSKNDQSIIAYRKDPIKENSVVGNFFTLSPIEGYSKYQIDFDNLLDTNVLGLVYKDGQHPAEILSKIWFPHINFEELSKQYNIPVVNLKNKANAQKAIKMGFDGIKFGDTLIQGLK